jgi:uncharacterized phiE125 gp8 family phage protein
MYPYDIVPQYTLKIAVPPADKPLSLAETKIHLRVDADLHDDDAYINSMIMAATNMAEAYTGRALITQTWDMYSDFMPAYQFEIPKPPLQSISYIKYIHGSTGVLTTIPTLEYQVDLINGRVRSAYGYYLPAARSDYNAVNVRFVAGYGVDPSNVPGAIRHAMLMIIGHLYEHRESVSDQAGFINPEEVPQGAIWLLNPYRVSMF